MILGATVAAALLLAGCAPATDAGGPDPRLRGQWELQSAKDATGTLPLKNQRITLTIGGDRTTTGRSTCSDYTARVFGTASRMWITARLPKDENCRTSSQQELEIRYIADLKAVRYGNVVGGVLTLQSSNLKLKFARALRIPLTLVTDRNWDINLVGEDNYTIDSDYGPVEATGASLRFSSTGALTGHDGCRSFTGRYAENAGELIVSNLRSTKKSCDQRSLSVDSYLMDLLTEGFTWQSSDGDLNLDSPRAGVAVGFIENPLLGSDLG